MGIEVCEDFVGSDGMGDAVGEVKEGELVGCAGVGAAVKIRCEEQVNRHVWPDQVGTSRNHSA